MRPFALPAGERTYQFLTGWITRLLRIGGWQVSGEDPSEIRSRIEDLYSFRPELRTLGVLVHSLPAKMWPAFGRWHGDGAWGKYFDNPAGETDLELADWQVIDLAGAAEHEDLCEAALFYLLERLRLALENPAETARVKLMVVDEAWRYLRDPGRTRLSRGSCEDMAEEKRGPDYGDAKRRGRDRHRRGRGVVGVDADQTFSRQPRAGRPRRPTSFA